MKTPKTPPVERDKPLHKPRKRAKPSEATAEELEALCHSRDFWGRHDGKAHEHGLWEETFFSAAD